MTRRNLKEAMALRIFLTLRMPNNSLNSSETLNELQLRHELGGYLRRQKGWSQERLAEEAGIHRTYLGGIETARRNPSLRNLIRIAAALGVPMGKLFQD